MSPPARPSAATFIRGVYAITADEPDTSVLSAKVQAVLAAGVRTLQYRNKCASPSLQIEQLQMLKALCQQHRALLIVNDDWRLARRLGIDAVHLGVDDGDLREARAELGEQVLIGVSCYGSLERARQLAPWADYLAFGALFSSQTKPQAPGTSLAVLREARALGLPVVGIGGIDAGNIASVLEAGADAAAVIGALFHASDPGAAARTLLQICDKVQAGQGNGA